MDSDRQPQSTALITRSSIIAYAIAALFLCYEMALQVSPGVMTHDLMRDLLIDATGLGVIQSAYFSSYTMMQIPVGLLFDRFSVRRLMSVAILVCAMGAVFFGMTHSLAFASLGRFFMGFGSAFAFISVLVVASMWFPSRVFALLVGIAQCLAALGAMMGEGPFANAVDAYGWRAVTKILAAIGFGLLIFCWWLIKEREPADSLHDHSEKHFNVIASIKAVLGQRQTWWLAVYAFACWAGMTVFPATWGSAYLMERYDFTRSSAAWAVSLIWVGLAVASPIVGWLSDRIGQRTILLQATSVLGLVSTLCLLYVPTVPLPLIYTFLFCFGVAASGQIISFAVVRDINHAQVRATAIGFNNMAVVAGGIVFPYFVGYLLKSGWQGQGQVLADNLTPIYSIENYHQALMVIPLCFLLSFISSFFFIKETYCQERSSL